MSSAYACIEEDKGSVRRSLIYMLNSMGPSKDPCGTPFLRGCMVDVAPLVATNWFLLDKNDCIIDLVFEGRFSKESLSSRI